MTRRAPCGIPQAQRAVSRLAGRPGLRAFIGGPVYYERVPPAGAFPGCGSEPPLMFTSDDEGLNQQLARVLMAFCELAVTL